MVADALGDRATLHTLEGAAGFHCQTGAGQELSRAIHAWLNKTLGKATKAQGWLQVKFAMPGGAARDPLLLARWNVCTWSRLVLFRRCGKTR